VRLALADRSGRGARAVIDRTGTRPGRGAYLCRAAPADAVPAPACLALAERRRGISRALRCTVTFDPEFVESVNQ